MDDNFVSNIVNEEGISQFSSEDQNSFFFLGEKDYKQWQQAPLEHSHIVTGFGPTNAPTAGTLSIIFSLKRIFEEKNADTTIIISELGAFNSRQLKIEKIDENTERFLLFLKSVGCVGKIRTHANYSSLVTSCLTSKYLTLNDFVKNQEIFTDLYKSMGLQGEDFPTFFDMNLTVADILDPIIHESKNNVLVLCGPEEHYFPKLANTVISRMASSAGASFFPGTPMVSTVYGKIIHGLNGYPKMSKSIPLSSLSLNDSEMDIREKILNNNENQDIILEIITQVSDWPVEKIIKARAARNNLEEWEEYKKEYLDYFLNIKEIWEKTKSNKSFSVGDLYGRGKE